MGKLLAPWRRWLREDVFYIVTAEEASSFKRLQTDEERQKFVELFWLRRDPTPDTIENEYKQEHYRPIAYANEAIRRGNSRLEGRPRNDLHQVRSSG